MSPDLEPILRLHRGIEFAAAAVCEWRMSRRRLAAGRGGRWFANLIILLIDIAVVRLIAPTAVVGAAFFAAERGWGLLPRLDEPTWAAVILSFITLNV